MQRVAWQANGSWSEIDVDVLVLSHGVVPNIHLPAALGAELAWNADKSAFQPVVDAWGGTSVASLWVAGDAAGIAGAEAAQARGRLAALAVANALGRIDAAQRDAEAERHVQAHTHALRGRRFLDVLYRPDDAFLRPEGGTLVCRCEEVTADAVREAVRDGADGLSAVKAATRCGMGACQGRFCLLTATELIAQERGVAPGAGGAAVDPLPDPARHARRGRRVARAARRRRARRPRAGLNLSVRRQAAARAGARRAAVASAWLELRRKAPCALCSPAPCAHRPCGPSSAWPRSPSRPSCSRRWVRWEDAAARIPRSSRAPAPTTCGR